MPGSFLYKNRIEEWNQTIDINIKGVLYEIKTTVHSITLLGIGSDLPRLDVTLEKITELDLW